MDNIKHDTLLEGATFKSAREFIRRNFKEVYYVPPGYKILKDCYLVGVPPIAVAIENSNLIFPIVKPHYGTFVVKAQAEQDITKLRDHKISTIKT
ncbi:MAG: DUF1894 domain-containing protein [Methanotrichaceae archaeon]